MPLKIEKVFHHFERWEDFRCGMYREVHKSKQSFFVSRAIQLLSNPCELFLAMQRVVMDWRYSSEENLTNQNMNRRAWLGQAACCLEGRTPEYLTRFAWHKLTESQQNEANKIADTVIEYWEKKQFKMPKRYLSKDVLTAAKERIAYTLDNFERAYISFSGGKDSTVMLHLVMEEAKRRGVKVGVFFLDWECQFTMTIQHVRHIFDTYADHIEPYWICLPILTDNACSQFETTWSCWDEAKKELWVREKEPVSIQDKEFFPFYYEGITFEEFTPLFAKWYAQGKPCANFIGIRTVESLNRFRAIAAEKRTFGGNMYTTNTLDECWNIYPIYDWETQDIWVYNAKTGLPYNRLYDVMYKAGMSIHQMRIDEPFGDTSRKSLWLYQVVEPAIWAKILGRVAGANVVNEYGGTMGNILGNYAITLPKGNTWQSFANLILDTMPAKTSEHYKGKIAVYLKWYRGRGYPDSIPDEAPMELKDKVPCWRRICKTLLKNDYWCKGLGFSVNKSSSYEKYLNLMRRRRNEWGIYQTETA